MGRKRRKSSSSLTSLITILIIAGVAIVKYIDSKNIAANNNNAKENYDTQQEQDATYSSAISYEIPNYNPKAGGQIIKHKGFTLYYNADYKTPYWVGWELTKKNTYGKENRAGNFLPDPDVIGAKAYTKDYTSSGYDRGHMAPAADMKWDKKAMEESFYLSNVCPQNQNLNRGDWNDLEELSRKMARMYKRVYITCGPIYDSKSPQRIGNNKVAVPNAFFKVIFINKKNSHKAYGFIFDNKAGHKPLRKYIVAVDSIENRTGIDFFPTLDKKIQDRIESEIHYSISEQND